ncbi:MAG TPA: F0F1 ATP synthase subunit B [Stellaceae bacterium]|nr:F0F1 ATP synthase subunit B [Stellaceae bacterium]
MPELFRDPEIWVHVAFAIAIVVLYLKGWPIVARGLDTRADKIRGELDEAKRLREEAQRVLAEYQIKQRDALKEAEQIVAQARVEAERAAQQAQRDLEAAIERRQRLAEEKIALAESKAATEVRNAAIDVAVAAVRQMLAQELDATRRSRLIDDAIADLPQRLN